MTVLPRVSVERISRSSSDISASRASAVWASGGGAQVRKELKSARAAFFFPVLNRLHCEILGITDDAGEDDVRRAYRRLARDNHPDRFPADQRPRQAVIMMRINDAYRQVRSHFRGVTAPGPPAVRPAAEARGWYHDLHGDDVEVSDESSVGSHKDPAYAYYKQGFLNYSAGIGGMQAGRVSKLLPNAEGLARAATALRKFQAAYSYFIRVVEDYPDSIWAPDTGYRLRRIERFNIIYRRIHKNLRERVAEDPETTRTEG